MNDVTNQSLLDAKAVPLSCFRKFDAIFRHGNMLAGSERNRLPRVLLQLAYCCTGKLE